jgi:ribosomal protein S18 acetylase RimI-like enzyme
MYGSTFTTTTHDTTVHGGNMTFVSCPASAQTVNSSSPKSPCFSVTPRRRVESESWHSPCVVQIHDIVPTIRMKKPSLADIRIRTKIRPGDIGYLTYLHGTLYSKEYGYGVDFETYVAAGLAEFKKQFDPARSRMWVCDYKQRMVGAIVLVNRGDSAQLRYFLIDPAFRGIGLGQKLMKLFMKFLRESGYRHVYLLTTHEQEAAAHLYKSYGFKLTNEEPVTGVFGKPVREQRYDLIVPAQ